MKIGIIDPFYDTSHRYWAEGLCHYSEHDIEVFYNPPKYWKWQMVGGTIEMAERIKPRIHEFDLLLVTDILDLPCFLGFLKNVNIPPIAIYFHENQITYPWSPSDSDVKEKRDHHYGFMNLRSAMVADHVIFNSQYHRESFIGALPSFMNMYPSISWPMTAGDIDAKSSVLSIGIPEVQKVRDRSNDEKPIFVWNHRWEYDKNPKEFFETLFILDKMEIDFGLIVLGQSYADQPGIFSKAQKVLETKIQHWGFAISRSEYVEKLQEGNISLVTSKQDFFGISVIEAIQYGNFPLLPERLSYREHLHTSNTKSIYKEGELLEKLIQAIDNQCYRGSRDTAEYIKKYNWIKVIEGYDRLFESMIL